MPRVRIVCISDTHGQHAKLSVPDGDVLIHAGDFMTFGDKPNEIIDFNLWLGRQPHRHKVVIAGNHDWMFVRHPGAARELLDNAIYLENSGTKLAGLRIWGSPVQPEFNGWAFNVARGAAIRRYWKMIPENTDVLLTHGPPFGVLDKSHPSTAHLGCEELAKTVRQIKPRLHVFGHIHGGHGLSTGNGTQFVNASMLNEAYRLAYASKHGTQLQPETLLYAQYVMVLTTFPRQEFSLEQVLERYRFRWQIELVFKRFKQIAQLGHLPKYDEDSAKAWLYGRLFVTLLTEKLIRNAGAISPWGFPLARQAPSEPVA